MMYDLTVPSIVQIVQQMCFISVLWVAGVHLFSINMPE